MRVLVADDDRVYRMLMAHALSKWGYEVELVCDGDAALASLEGQHRPCLAILDWRMPGLDGIELCRRVRAQPQGQYVYLLLVTATVSILAGPPRRSDELQRGLRS